MGMWKLFSITVIHILLLHGTGAGHTTHIHGMIRGIGAGIVPGIVLGIGDQAGPGVRHGDGTGVGIGAGDRVGVGVQAGEDGILHVPYIPIIDLMEDTPTDQATIGRPIPDPVEILHQV